jgi:hypothetical protein
MMHHSTWLGEPRLKRWTRTSAPLAFLLACMLLAAFAQAASATTPYDMRGEWSVEYKSAGEPPLSETGIIKQMNLSTGEYSATFQASIGIPTEMNGTMSGTTGSLTTTTVTPFGTLTFITSSLTVETVGKTLSAPGTFYLNGKDLEPGTLTGTETKTYQEVVEREEREQKEREEAQARQAVRGEWAITLESGPQVLKGIALIKEPAGAKNEFASSNALFESVVPGSFAGTLKGKEASVTIVTQAAGPYPESRFESTEITVGSGTSSMSGPGMLMLGPSKAPTMLTATRLRTYAQIEEQERQAQEAKEKQEREAAEKVAREQAEKVAREAKEREAREAIEKAAKTGPIVTITPKAVLLPVALGGTSLTVSHSGTVALLLTNPNASSVQGQLKLTLPKGGKASAKHTTKSTTLATATFSISSHGSATVKVKLSRSGRSQLAHHKALRVLLTLTTQASGEPSVVKTYSVTLHAGKH